MDCVLCVCAHLQLFIDVKLFRAEIVYLIKKKHVQATAINETESYGHV